MKKITFVYAHPDDAEIWSGGTILNHHDNGDEIMIIYTHVEDDTRKDEASLIKKHIQAVVCFADNNSSLRAILSDFKPQTIVTHWEEDCHSHHRDTFQMINSITPQLLIEDGLKFTLYSCDTYNSFGLSRKSIFTPDVYIDISDNWDKKMKLIENHISQPIDIWKSMAERQNRIHGARSYAQYAEGYIRVSTLGYQMGYTKVLE